MPRDKKQQVYTYGIGDRDMTVLRECREQRSLGEVRSGKAAGAGGWVDIRPESWR